MKAIEIVVVGGGVKGSLTAALLSLLGARVTLVERSELGSGATSANHGRLHAGAASWRSDSIALMQHRYMASEPLRELLQVRSKQQWAKYCFENRAHSREFESKCRSAGIPFSRGGETPADNPWMLTKAPTDIFAVPDFAFRPAALAAQAGNVFLRFGGRLVIGDARSLEYCEGGLVMNVRHQAPLRADVVINSLSAWSAELKVPDDQIAVQIDRFCWSLFCVHRDRLGAVPRSVIVSTGEDGNGVSAVPHKNWVTFDTHDTPIKKLSSGREVRPCRKLNMDFENDRQIFRSISEKFGILTQIAPTEILLVTGTHGRIRGAAPGSKHKLIEGKRGYCVSFGGQASTSLADAIEVSTLVFKRITGQEIAKESLQEQFRLEFEAASGPLNGSMVWEQTLDM